MKIRKFLAFIAVLIISINFVQAGFNFRDDIVDPVRHAFSSAGDRIEEELERSAVGRELNRIIDDIEEVAEIVEEIGGIAALAASATTPAGIVNLAVQYGHDPDQIFGRFQERVNSLENRYNGELSETEIAAALQSVLEEPPLPNGTYMGDRCIIDLASCPSSVRGDYFMHSCYVEGIVDKKRVGGLNKAACTSYWIDTYEGDLIEVKFPVSAQDATYDWERCARALLPEQEQQEFIASGRSGCEQPIAKHDVGEACAVDYTSCSYGSGGEYNENRIGTIVYGLVSRNQRDYSCSIDYGDFTLRRELRDSCASVYVGNREVRDFISANPEPVRQARNNTQVQQALNITSQREGFLIRDLGDVPLMQEQPVRFAYGRAGILDIFPPTIQQKKNSTKESLEEFGVLHELDISKIKESEGQVLPGPIAKVFKNENIKIIIRQKYGEDLLVCASIKEGIVEKVDVCSEKEKFDTTIIVQTSQSVVENFDDANEISSALEDGRISYKGVGIGKKVKLGVSAFFWKTFKK